MGIVARQAKRGGEDTSFVLAFPVDWIERVIAQFRDVYERSLGLWKFHMIETSLTPASTFVSEQRTIFSGGWTISMKAGQGVRTFGRVFVMYMLTLAI